MNDKILVVDDNPEIRDVTRRILERAGLNVDTATDGYDALRQMQIEPPALIVLDLMMPGMSGWEVFDFVRANEGTARTRVLILSARDTAQEVDAGYDYGADYYLPKPFTRPQLLRAVGVLLRRPDLIDVTST